MTPWTLIDSARVPRGAGPLGLYQRGTEYSIRIGGRELMNSRAHGSEEALAELACQRLERCTGPRVLVGGLGMGYTLGAALRRLPETARVEVAELVPAVVAWNRGPLAGLAGDPLRDPRVTLYEGDVAARICDGRTTYDAIVLDVDNGPEGLTRKANDWLYALDGLAAARTALRPLGVLAIWSAGPDRTFAGRLVKVGFEVSEVRVRGYGRGGARHVVWVARRRD
jgi:spermidine synthase